MNSLFWTDGFWPRIGGIETQALQFLQNLMERGHRCAVIAQKDYPNWKDEETHQGIAIRRFDFDSIFSQKRLADLRIIESYLEELVKKFQPDLIHLNSCMGWAAFVFLLFRSKFQVPVVLTVHAPYFYGEKHIPLRDRVCSMADQICCVSGWVQNELASQTHWKEKLHLIYNGLPEAQIAPTPLCFSPPTLLLLGRLSPEKGFDTAIRAFSLLKQKGSNARLLIVGGGGEELFLKRLVLEHNLNESVQFAGPVAREEIPAWINRAALVLVPSYFETFGLAALEAMQMERPVIASHVGGLPEIVLDGKTGLLIPEKDPAALCEAIQSLLAAPEKAIRMGQEGRRRVEEHFTLDQHASAYEAIYAECIKNRKL